jgi:hypothetical protein
VKIPVVHKRAATDLLLFDKGGNKIYHMTLVSMMTSCEFEPHISSNLTDPVLFVPALVIISLFSIHEQADVDGNGTIDYVEFISATMHMNRLEKEDHIFKAFEYFDKDHSG